MTLIQEELEKRLELIEAIRLAFIVRFPNPPRRFRRGPIQRELLEEFELSATGFNRAIVSDALLQLGFEKVVVQGLKYYRRKLPTSS